MINENSKKTLISILKYVLSLGLAAFLLWYLYRDLDVQFMITKFKTLNYTWVTVSVIMALVSHYLRALRWNLFFESFGYKISNIRTFYAVMAGYFANLLVPRMGEVTRCGILKKNENVPLPTSLGTVVAERGLDMVMLLLVMTTAFLIEFDKLYSFFQSMISEKVEGFEKSSGYIVIALIVLVVLFILGIFLIRIFKDRIVSHHLYAKVTSILRQLMHGFLSIGKIKKQGQFWLATVGIWTLYYLMSYVMFFSMDETSNLGIDAGFAVLVMGGIGMAAPVQGGIGAYHLLVGSVLALYGLDKESGMTFAFILHSMQFLAILIFGGIGYIISIFLKPVDHGVSD